MSAKRQEPDSRRRVLLSFNFRAGVGSAVIGFARNRTHFFAATLKWQITINEGIRATVLPVRHARRMEPHGPATRCYRRGAGTVEHRSRRGKLLRSAIRTAVHLSGLDGFLPNSTSRETIICSREGRMQSSATSMASRSAKPSQRGRPRQCPLSATRGTSNLVARNANQVTASPSAIPRCA